MRAVEYTVKGNTETEIIINCIQIIVELLNDKFVTAHNKCSKTPPSNSMHFATRVRISSDLRASSSSSVYTFLS